MVHGRKFNDKLRTFPKIKPREDALPNVELPSSVVTRREVEAKLPESVLNTEVHELAHTLELADAIFMQIGGLKITHCDSDNGRTWFAVRPQENSTLMDYGHAPPGETKKAFNKRKSKTPWKTLVETTQAYLERPFTCTTDIVGARRMLDMKQNVDYFVPGYRSALADYCFEMGQLNYVNVNDQDEFPSGNAYLLACQACLSYNPELLPQQMQYESDVAYSTRVANIRERIRAEENRLDTNRRKLFKPQYYQKFSRRVLWCEIIMGNDAWFEQATEDNDKKSRKRYEELIQCYDEHFDDLAYLFSRVIIVYSPKATEWGMEDPMGYFDKWRQHVRVQAISRVFYVQALTRGLRRPDNIGHWTECTSAAITRTFVSILRRNCCSKPSYCQLR